MKEIFSDLRALWLPSVIVVFFSGLALSALGMVCFTIYSIFKLFAHP